MDGWSWNFSAVDQGTGLEVDDVEVRALDEYTRNPTIGKGGEAGCDAIALVLYDYRYA
jgi:hypothetical protein